MIHPKDGGQVGEGGMSDNHPRTLCVSGCDFQDPAAFQAGGVVGKILSKESL